MRLIPAAGSAIVVACALGAGAHPAAQGTPTPVDMANAPAAVTAASARADIAILELQTTLVGRLKAELSRGGPAAAVTVCRDEAAQMTAAVGEKHRLAIGRTSDRLRNPANAPRAWAAGAVAAHAGEKAADVAPMVFDLGGRIGVLKPIGTADFCVLCHGERAAVDAVIGDVLKSAYPQDQAVGFAPGDLRGWFWAEVDLP